MNTTPLIRLARGFARLFERLSGALALSLVAALCAGAAQPAEPQPLRISVLKVGTVNWELDTIRHHGLDIANGIALDVRGVAGAAAAKIAFQGGATDVIVSDWIWVARRRAAGEDFVFIPYSKAVGGVMVGADDPARTFADLAGARIGVAGGPLDKSWLILRAYGLQEHGFDIANAAEPVFAAPPLIFKSALNGDLRGAVNYWHFLAKMEVAGMRSLVDVETAAAALGLDPETPLLGYVVRGDLIRTHPGAVRGLVAASKAAKALLGESDEEWERLRPMMNAATDAEFEALKEGFRAGAPAARPVDEAAAARFLDVLGRFGGEALLAAAATLPPGVFYTGAE